MRIATLNVNSVRIRLDLIQAAAEATRADVLCLQETKVQDHEFPLAALQMLGFPHIYFSGQKSYNGVAILSKHALEKHHSFDVLKNGDKRHIAALLPDGSWLHNFYVPAGGDIPDAKVNSKFADKLAFMAAMHDWSGGLPAKEKHILVGDLNIAPHEHDVWSHKQLLDVVSHTPVETEAMRRLRESAEWVDCAREFTPMEQKLYSWWSYRNRDWAKSDRGRRLDHVWVTPNLKKRLASTNILRELRAHANPSDHVPVVMELAD
jgi:exodeoxyribonuclease-3